MEPKTKDLLDEMIQYMDTWEPGTYLKSASQSMEPIEIAYALGVILSWQIDITLNLEKPEKITVNSYNSSQLEALLKQSPELNKLFEIKEGFLLWSKINTDSRREFSEYISNNYDENIKRTYRVDEKKEGPYSC